MSHQSSVSVVMSCFNDEATVGRAIKSIQAQTLQDWELVVINDGSSDGTAEILDNAAESDSRIRVYHQPNSGLTRALILGCEKAQSHLIARHDADDVSEPNRLAIQKSLLDHDSTLGFVSCWAESFTPDGAPLEKYCCNFGKSEATDRLLNHREGPPAHGTIMMRKSVYNAVGGYRACFYYGQDADLWMRMAECSQFTHAPEVLYRFLRSPKSISGSQRHIQKQFGELGQLCRHARRANRPEAELLRQATALAATLRNHTSDATRAGLSAVAMTYLIGSKLVSNGDPRARSYLFEVLRRRPLHWKAWVRLGQSYLSSHEAAADGTKEI